MKIRYTAVCEVRMCCGTLYYYYMVLSRENLIVKLKMQKWEIFDTFRDVWRLHFPQPFFGVKTYFGTLE